MYGSATLAIVESSACISVAAIAQSVMMARCGTSWFGLSALPDIAPQNRSPSVR